MSPISPPISLDQVNHTWSSADLGADIIEVPRTDATSHPDPHPIPKPITDPTPHAPPHPHPHPHPDQVPTTDANYGLGTYYIAVYGGGGGTECRFTISVSSKVRLG